MCVKEEPSFSVHVCAAYIRPGVFSFMCCYKADQSGFIFCLKKRKDNLGLFCTEQF